jgi:hypothetical protein
MSMSKAVNTLLYEQHALVESDLCMLIGQFLANLNSIFPCFPFACGDVGIKKAEDYERYWIYPDNRG